MREAEISWLDPYRERWDLLDKPTAAIPFLTSSWFIEQSAVFGLPAGHQDFDTTDAS